MPYKKMNGIWINNMTSNFNYYPTTLSTAPTYDNITTIDGYGVMTLYNTTSGVIPLSGPCTADGPINIAQQNLQYLNTLTIGSNQTITGFTTNQIINDPTGYCEDAISNYQLYINTAVINNCKCCKINVINPVPIKN